MSLRDRCPIVFQQITCSNRFANKNGEPPKIMNVIDGYKIVLSKEELTENNWLFIVKEGEEEDVFNEANCK